MEMINAKNAKRPSILMVVSTNPRFGFSEAFLIIDTTYKKRT